MAPDPYSILVSERDTRSIFYPGTGTWHPIHIFYPGTGTWHQIHIFYHGTGTWHPIHILSWCRNVTPDPYSILVSERDTRSIFYPGTGTWHPIHILSWYRNVAPDPYAILVSERGTRSPNLTNFIHQAFFNTKASSLTK